LLAASLSAMRHHLLWLLLIPRISRTIAQDIQQNVLAAAEVSYLHHRDMLR
jgi:hypothetical protein